MSAPSITFRTVRETYVSDRKRHLDWNNDAWLYADGDIAIRAPGNEFKIIGNVSNLHGAARISKALSMVFAYRGT